MGDMIHKRYRMDVNDRVIVDPVFILINCYGLNGGSLHLVMQKMDWGFIFYTPGSYIDHLSRSKRLTWFVIDKESLVIFKLKYGDRIHTQLSYDGFEKIRDLVTRAGYGSRGPRFQRAFDYTARGFRVPGMGP